MLKTRKIVIVLLLIFAILGGVAVLNKTQASTPADIIASMESQNKIEEEQMAKARGQAMINLVLRGASFIAIIGYLVFLLLYTSKLGTKINEPKGLLYLSFLIPLAGLILYCVYIKKNEKLGKACGKLAIFGVTMPIVFIAILVIGVLINNGNNVLIT